MLNTSLVAGVGYSYLIFVIKCQPNRHTPFFASTTGANRALLRKKTSKLLLSYLKWKMEKRGMILEWSCSTTSFFGCIFRVLSTFYSNPHGSLIPVGPVPLLAGISHPHLQVQTCTGMGAGQLNLTRGWPVSITRGAGMGCSGKSQGYLLWSLPTPSPTPSSLWPFNWRRKSTIPWSDSELQTIMNQKSQMTWLTNNYMLSRPPAHT